MTMVQAYRRAAKRVKGEERALAILACFHHCLARRLLCRHGLARKSRKS